MDYIIEINNLNYLDFKDFNLKIKKHSYTSIVGSIKSGKTTLVKILSGLIETNDVCKCNDIVLNKDNTFNYLKNIGVISYVNKNSFLFKTVREELSYPLLNLGYPQFIVNKIINDKLKEFNMLSIIDKKIDILNTNTKQKLLFIIALLHKPKVLIIDEAFMLLNDKDKKVIFNYLRKMVNDKKITVINFTKDLNEVINSDNLVLLDKFSIKKMGIPMELLIDDQLFYDCGLEIPFMVDLSIKLKMYNLVDKVYLNMEDMVNEIWK